MGNLKNEDTVWCFEAGSGRVLWRHTYAAQLGPQWYEGGPGSTPTVSGHQVFTISKWGDVFCLEAATGAVRWQRDLRQDGVKPNRWGFAGSPLIRDNAVILNAGSAGIALDRETGRVLWSTGTNAAGYASPTSFDSGGAAFGFNPGKGQPTCIVANTIKGKGVSFMENNPKFHGVAPTPQEVELALKELA